MARADTPWQAEFREQDRKLIIEWINSNLNPTGRWGLPLAEQGSPLQLAIHRPLICKFRPDLDTKRARKMLRELGFDRGFIDSYTDALRTARSRLTEDDVFANMWLNLSEAGAGVRLEKILTTDKENEKRWKAYLKKEGKKWANVQLSHKAKGLIGEEVIRSFGLEGYNAEALRVRFRRYAKRYLS